MDAQVYQAVSITLYQSLAGHPMSIEAHGFIRATVFESLNERGREWQTEGMNPDDAGNAEGIAIRVRDSVAELLANTPSTGAHNQILLIDVMAGVQARWCRIFPFCR